MVKILVIGDLHGQKPKIHFKEFDAIIMTGDVCSDKDFRPLKNKWMRFLNKNPNTSISLDVFIEKQIGKKKFKEFDKKSLLIGRKILKYLNSFGKPVFLVPGNWDQSYGPTRIKDINKSDYHRFKAFLDFYKAGRLNYKLVRGLKNIKDCHYKLHKFKGINILGYGLSSSFENPSLKRHRINGPKKDYTENQYKNLKRAYNIILDKLKNVYMKNNKKFPTIFISHNVPYNTSLDIINAPGMEFHKKHFGSAVARWFCVKHKPLLCIGGHMHEHFKKTKLGKTIAINAGFGKDANILIEINDKTGKIKKIKFYKKII